MDYPHKSVILCLSFLLMGSITCGYSPRMKVFTFEEDNSEIGTKEVKSNELEEDVNRDDPNENPDIHLTTPELIQRHGFPAEIHTVTSEDGYILTLHRIPHGKNNSNLNGNKSRPVVFLQHGMFGTSADWVINVEQKSLGFMVAEAGYDVWLGNSRGNQYSQAHVTLSTKHIAYWRFSWDEMGRYDLPAVIDYVLNATGKENLSYVGHSMGTSMFFVFLSTRPEYNSKVNFMAAFGPAVYLKHTAGPAKILSELYGRAEKIILDILGHGIFLPKFISKTLEFIGPEFCTPEMRLHDLCEEVVFLLAGHDPKQINYTQLPVMLAHVPSTVSTQTGFHYFQNIRSGEFQMYDHGKWNSRDYRKSTPKKYDLSNVKAPVALFWGQNDIICTPVDVDRLERTLPNVVLNFRVDFPEFNHVDFVVAKDVDILVNKPLIKILSKYN